MKDVRVLFVCLGNICRSPAAEGIFRGKVRQQKIDWIQTDSAGTYGGHSGAQADARSRAVCASHGVDIEDLRSRQVRHDDFWGGDNEYRYILAMDASNLADLEAMAPPNFLGKMELLLRYIPDDPEARALNFSVPDPYYGGAHGFERMYQLLDRAVDALFLRVVNERAGH